MTPNQIFQGTILSNWDTFIGKLGQLKHIKLLFKCRPFYLIHDNNINYNINNNKNNIINITFLRKGAGTQFNPPPSPTPIASN